MLARTEARLVPRKVDREEYNFSRFGMKQLIADAERTVRCDGIEPGAEAPPFELPMVGGETLRLEALRGRPVLLRFGSFT